MTAGLITTLDIVASTAKTDGQVGIPIVPGTALSGTWTPSIASEVLILTRTANAAKEYYLVPIKIPHRTTALKGIKLKSVSVSYTVNTADTAADDLEFHIMRQILPADTAVATGSVLAGDDNADYDATHNTKAKRLLSTGAPEKHTLTVTIPTGEQVYAADGVHYWLRVMIEDATTANLAFILTGAVANFDVAAL